MATEDKPNRRMGHFEREALLMVLPMVILVAAVVLFGVLGPYFLR